MGGGGPQKADERNKIKRFVTATGEGVKKSENFADVIYGSPIDYIKSLDYIIIGFPSQNSFFFGISIAEDPAIPSMVSCPTSLKWLCTLSSYILPLFTAGAVLAKMIN